jgi:pectate lyase
VQFYDCNGDIKIYKNFFESGVQQQMYRMEHLGLTQSHNANFIVENNVFKNAENHDPSKAPCGICF